MKKKSIEYLRALEQWAPKPPDMEKTIIGCCLLGLHDDDWEKVETLEPEMFYDRQLGELFGIIKQLRAEGRPADFIIVSREVLNPDLKTKLNSIISSFSYTVHYTEHLGYYAKIVHQEYLKRSYYSLLQLAPSLFVDSIGLDDFLEKFAKVGNPLFGAIGLFKERGEATESSESQENEEEEQMLAARAAFIPHYLVNGEEKYKVLMSKFKPYNGYVWVKNKAVKEEQMLKKGFKISYE